MAVEFNNQPQIERAKLQKRSPLMVQKLMNWGIAKSEKQANMYLTVLAVLFLAVSLYFWFV